jgi:hypothetical protein
MSGLLRWPLSGSGRDFMRAGGKKRGDKTQGNGAADSSMTFEGQGQYERREIASKSAAEQEMGGQLPSAKADGLQL